MKRKKISIVVPVYNEEAVLGPLHERLAGVAKGLPFDFEFLFVSDGSTDGSLAKLIELSRADPRVVVLDLTRNFGQHPALTAGIDAASGDAVILMDADLEDDPGHVARLIEAWAGGAEVVYALRGKRRSGLLRRVFSKLFHEINRRLEQHVPMAGTFSLMDRKVVEALRLMPERNRYIPGLRTLAGFRQEGLTLDRGSRYDDRPRVSFLRLVRLALSSYVAFSKLPLKLASITGLLLSLVAFLAILFIVVYQLMMGFVVSGWASLMVTLIFTSGIQLICLGILGEYVAQILDETKRRPVYLVRAKIREGKAAPLEEPRL